MAVTKPHRPYRIVQWGTGNVERRALRSILDHPEFELVGLHAFSREKQGMDAGTLAGAAPIGVLATDDRGALAHHPDCVSYMPTQLDYDIVERFLRSGVNVVTTGDYLTGTNQSAAVVTSLENAETGGRHVPRDGLRARIRQPTGWIPHRSVSRRS